MKFVRLKQPFEIYLIGGFEEGYKALQKCSQASAYKTSLYAKPCQMLLIYLKRLTLLEDPDPAALYITRLVFKMKEHVIYIADEDNVFVKMCCI